MRPLRKLSNQRKTAAITGLWCP